MPIWLRKFTFNKLKEYYEKEIEESTTKKSSIRTLQPDVDPTYYSRLAKK